MNKKLKLNQSAPPFFVAFTLPCTSDLGSQGLGQCIADIYTWSLAIVGVVALVQILYAGWLYVTAFGNANKVGDAMSRISRAILGMVLLFSSYLILRTINPDLLGGTVTLPETTLEKNTGSLEDLTQIKGFSVEPVEADLSDNTPLTYRVKIYGSQGGVDQLCGQGTTVVFYDVYYKDTATSPPTDLKVRYYSWNSSQFGSGKTLSLDFQQELTKGLYNSTLPVKPGTASYYLKFSCQTPSGNELKTLNTSAPFTITVKS